MSEPRALFSHVRDAAPGSPVGPAKPPISARLDIGTKLVDASSAGWHAKVYVEAGEAVWVYRGSTATRTPETLEPEGDGSVEAVEHDNVGRAERRSRTTIRRYCATNQIDRLWSLTYAPPFCFDPEQLRHDLASFIRRARYDASGQHFPYVWVPELHADGERFHAHIGLAHFVNKADVARLWPHGFVDGRRIRGRRSQSQLANARTTARYLAKYVGKTFAPGQARGLHRYEVAQGFQPRPVEISCRTEDEVFGRIVEAMHGEVPSRTWRSEDIEDGEMPPLIRGGFW